MLVIAQPEEPGARDAALTDRPFGLRWFVPELLRHKALWREVLAASLVLQVIALLVPLCTQVIIDKVVVHNSSSTVAVILAALAMFVAFSAGLSYARQYLLLHTGNRIDAVLGMRAFEHLLRLPPRYFETRPTGTLVARLHGVETIREFITGAAASVLLDLPFLLVFLGAMLWYSVPLTLIALGVIVALALASLAVTPLLRHRINEQFQQAAIAVQRLGDLMDAPAELYSLNPDRARKPGAESAGRIEIDKVSFRYRDEQAPVYENFSLTIEPGACVALTGPSGSGKSTLAKLLQGFYVPAAGAVRIDGRDTRQLPANELRLNFGVVPQETRLFSGTLFENLVAAQPHASSAEVVEACRQAEIHEFIEGLPQGYRTPVGENGVGLSGGPKQRIAIARALLRRPRILIFDEATASLDRETAESFGRTVSRLRGSATVLFISHHLPESLAVDRGARLESQLSNLDRLDARQQRSGT